MLPVCPSPNKRIPLLRACANVKTVWCVKKCEKERVGHICSSPPLTSFFLGLNSSRGSTVCWGSFWETTGVTQLSLGHKEGIRTRTHTRAHTHTHANTASRLATQLLLIITKTASSFSPDRERLMDEDSGNQASSLFLFCCVSLNWKSKRFCARICTHRKYDFKYIL